MSTAKAIQDPSPSKSHRSAKRVTKKSTLAPDGLPWPEGYFDRPPRQTFEEAIAIHGVRPSHYRYGWPAYTLADMALPGFKSAPPPEPPELEKKWRKECDDWDAKQKKQKKSNGAHAE